MKEKKESRVSAPTRKKQIKILFEEPRITDQGALEFGAFSPAGR